MGRKHSEETRRRIGEANRGKLAGRKRSEETRKKISATLTEKRRGKRNATEEPATGSYIDSYGYRILTMLYDHPLVNGAGVVSEQRYVLWQKLGCESRDCQHPCHWCGKMLDWHGHRGLVADHLDDDTLNNSPENLEPSCRRCNWGRKRRRDESIRQPSNQSTAS